MQDNKRNKAYVWVTWLRDHITTDRCMWKAWYKSNYRYAKKSDDGDGKSLKEWQKQHDEMTQIRVMDLKKEGFEVRVEDENAFKLQGQTATLAGKPDIVALKSDEKRAIVIDEKSGSIKESNRWQVFIYMFSLPKVWASGWTVNGEVEYRGSTQFLTADYLTETVVNKIVSGMTALGKPTPPPRNPSSGECRFCNILNCPDRYNEGDRTGDASQFF